MYQPVSLGQLYLLPPSTAVRVLGQLDRRERTLRSATGAAELLGPLPPRPPQRVELWGQLVGSAPNRVLVHGLQPLTARGPAPKPDASTKVAPTRPTPGPFEGAVRLLSCGQTTLAQDAQQRIYRVQWAAPSHPWLCGPGEPCGAGLLWVAGEVLPAQPEQPEHGRQGHGWQEETATPTLRVQRISALAAPPDEAAFRQLHRT